MMKTLIPKVPNPEWPHWKLIVWSLAGWEPIASLLVSGAFFGAWMKLGPFPLTAAHLSVLIVGSTSMAVIARNEWREAASLLEGSPYGELIRIADSKEDEYRAPYQIGIALSILATLTSVVGALSAELVVSRTGQALFVAVVALPVSWSVLAVVSNAVRSAAHHRRAAEVRETKERTAADEREVHRQRKEQGHAGA